MTRATPPPRLASVGGEQASGLHTGSWIAFSRKISHMMVETNIAGESFIIQGGQHGLGLHAATIAACNAAGFSPRVGQEAPRLASTLNLVAVGLGISIVPDSLRRMHMDGVAYRRLKGSAHLKAPLILASRRGDPSGVVRQFLNLVKGTATSDS